MTRSTLPRPAAGTDAGRPPHLRGDTRAVTGSDFEARFAVLRGMLEQQRAFRVEQLLELQRPGSPGLLSSANREVLESLAAGARAALHDVQHALWRMDEGVYGLCTSCGEPLDLQRLEILPQAALCLPCQRTAAERLPHRRIAAE